MVRHFFDLDYDVNITLNETLQVLSKTKPIMPDECYINDYIAQHPEEYTLPNGQLFKCTAELVPFFTGSTIMDTIKADMLELGNDICAAVRTEFSNTDGLASITVGDSGSVGISTYIHVRLKQPTDADPYVANRIKSDPQFLNHYMSGYHNDGLSGEYNFKIRLSNHLKKNMRVEDAQINIDINNRVYEYFKDRVIYHIRNRLNYVNIAWNNYCKYGTLPKNQQKRNQERTAAKRAHRAWIYELYNKLNNDYTKLLHQNRLGKYAEQLEYAYTVIEDMIMHRRKEQTVGKKAVYTDWINKLTSKINAAELQMDALDKNVNIDIPKLIKSLNTLDKVVKDASKFIGYEDDAIATFGYTKQRPHVKIER